jgi:hypothetical protein
MLNAQSPMFSRSFAMVINIGILLFVFSSIGRRGRRKGRGRKTVPGRGNGTPEGRAYKRRVDIVILDDGHL